MELATGRRAVDGGEECLVEWAKRVMMTGNVRVAVYSLRDKARVQS